MHHNNEQKHRKIFLLMYGTYTSAETITSYIVPSPVHEESIVSKKQIAVILKQLMETYPKGLCQPRQRPPAAGKQPDQND